jgi:hypothetical protein
MLEDPAQVKCGVVRTDLKANDAISGMTERPIEQTFVLGE